MGLARVLIHAIDAALEDGEVALGRVGVVVAPQVFLGAVVNDPVVGEVPADRV